MTSQQGERGPHGDHGQAGDRGETGLDGAMGRDGSTGLAGLPGERGKTGDTGQAGQIGRVGEAGPIGPRGATGFTRRQVLALFLFLAFALTLLAYRSEVNANQIEENLKVSCEEDAVIAQNFNAVLDSAISDVRAASSDVPDADARERIGLYQAAKINSLPC